jgi:hypothetical protein
MQISNGAFFSGAFQPCWSGCYNMKDARGKKIIPFFAGALLVVSAVSRNIREAPWNSGENAEVRTMRDNNKTNSTTMGGHLLVFLRSFLLWLIEGKLTLN